jgi:hypothetical protein
VYCHTKNSTQDILLSMTCIIWLTYWIFTSNSWHLHPTDDMSTSYILVNILECYCSNIFMIATYGWQYDYLRLFLEQRKIVKIMNEWVKRALSPYPIFFDFLTVRVPCVSFAFFPFQDWSDFPIPRRGPWSTVLAANYSSVGNNGGWLHRHSIG